MSKIRMLSETRLLRYELLKTYQHTRCMSKVHKINRPFGSLAPSQGMTQGQFLHRVEGLGLAKHLTKFQLPRIKTRSYDQGPVVQSVVSLTSSLRVISLTVLADQYTILLFLAEKM